MAYAKSYQYIRSESVKMFFEFSYNFPIYIFFVCISNVIIVFRNTIDTKCKKKSTKLL